jgi:3',5'-cyclic AMP phosphodiesterase CpdA
MLNLVHISDLHFGKPYLAHVGAALHDAIHRLSPKALVVGGDLTQRAKRREFKAARAFLDRCPHIPRVVVPGNHDVPLYRVWERLCQPYGLYRRYIQEELDTVLRLEDAVIVGLDSTNPHGAIKNGRLSRAQLAWCAEVLASAPPEIYRIVALHHHLAPAPDYDHTSIMPKGKRALEFFTELKVDLMLSGHLHRAYVANSLDVYAGAKRDHGIILVQCGTSTSRRGRAREQEKNSFNWLQLTEHSIRIVHFMYFAEQERFAPTSQHEFARPNRGYLPQGVIPTDPLPHERL